MLQITRTEQGDYEPTTLCDWCGRPITDAATAHYEWLVDDRGELSRTTIFFAHKHCSHDPNTAPGYPHWQREELTQLLIVLTHKLVEGSTRDESTE